jgi:hypothetical protein
VWHGSELHRKHRGQCTYVVRKEPIEPKRKPSCIKEKRVACGVREDPVVGEVGRLDDKRTAQACKQTTQVIGVSLRPVFLYFVIIEDGLWPEIRVNDKDLAQQFGTPGASDHGRKFHNISAV